jgi:hypothetical protein
MYPEQGVHVAAVQLFEPVAVLVPAGQAGVVALTL